MSLSSLSFCKPFSLSLSFCRRCSAEEVEALGGGRERFMYDGKLEKTEGTASLLSLFLERLLSRFNLRLVFKS